MMRPQAQRMIRILGSTFPMAAMPAGVTPVPVTTSCSQRVSPDNFASPRSVTFVSSRKRRLSSG